MKKIKKIALCLSILAMTSCASKKDVLYYSDIDVAELKENIFNTEFQVDDLLMIVVTAQDPLAAQPFNVTTTFTVNPLNQAGGGQYQQHLYLVDSNGNIEFPILGTLKVAGKTKHEFTEELKTKISQYIVNPIINLRLMNFQVSVQGEVARPNVYTFNSERITLPEVLAQAGDLTIHGNRKNVLIIRDQNGKQITKRIDLTSSDFINSDFYYLKQNDIVYVEPNQVRVNSSAVGPNVSVIISVASLLITIATLTIRK
ncbi:MAG TPA: polysaccharide biosynthesis/export family protein [Flavobacterium sp.]|nr:polysaccharide biosynthesis/export family protein [Flavobacterium sp.]